MKVKRSVNVTHSHTIPRWFTSVDHDALRTPFSAHFDQGRLSAWERWAFPRMALSSQELAVIP
eukprot:541182-Amphidinium_carterae.1